MFIYIYYLLKKMENVLIEDSSLNEYFKPEHDTQNLENNPLFIKWKQSIIKSKGKDAKFLKCKYDNIIFACTKKSLKEPPIYLSKCPVCKYNICYYCSFFATDSYRNGLCCVKRRITCMFLQDGFRYINPIVGVYDDHLNFFEAFKIFIVPVLSFLWFITEIQISFFYKLDFNEKAYQYDNEISSYERFMGYRRYKMLIIV